MNDNGKNIVVKVENLTIGYDKNVVLENISFEVAKGEIFVILGGSGCGKTTLLKHLNGLYRPMSGEVLIRGKSIVRCNIERRREIMKTFGVLYQTGALFGSLTLFENVALPLEEFTDYPREKIAQIVREKLKLVDLDGFDDYMPCELSGGMRKRAGLARAIALEPDILFFDEPSTSLDPLTAASLDRLIIDINGKLGSTMVIVTHELDSIFAISNRVIMLDKETKGIIAEGRPYDLKENSKNPKVREFLNRAGLSRRI